MNQADHILLLILIQGLTAMEEGVILQVTIIPRLLPNQHITTIQGHIKTGVTVIALLLPIQEKIVQVTGQAIQLLHAAVQAV